MRAFGLSFVMAVALGLTGCATNKEARIAPPAQAPAVPQADGGSPSATAIPMQSVQELSVREEKGQTTLLLKFAQPINQYRHFTLPQPPRIVLDILDVSKAITAAETYRIDTNWVSTLRLNASENSLRLVIEIAGATVPTYTVSTDNDGLSILIGAVDPKATARKNLTLIKGGKRVDLQTGEFACAPSIGEMKSPVASESRELAGEKQYSGQKVSLEFKDADIKNVFRLLAEISGKNILVTDDVNKKITVRLIEVPWDQALDLIVDTNGLAKEETGNVVRISTAARLAQDKKAQLDARDAARKIAIRQTSYINVNYASAKDLVDKVRQIVKSSPDFAIVPDAIVPDERSNTIVVHGTNKDVQDVACLVSRLDVRTPQVLIESNLVETTPTFARSLGINMATAFNKGRVQTRTMFPAGSPFSGTPTITPDSGGSPIVNPASGFIFGYLGNNVAAALTAAENEGNVKIISRPSVVTLNGVPSTIRSDRILRIALPTGTTNNAIGSTPSAGPAIAVQEIPIGITLSVTPQVSSDGFVLMNIRVRSSSIANSATVSGGTAGVIPFDELNREAEVNVLVRDGETIVIGGILKDTAQDSTGGVPYLKDIPVLGWLFKNWSVQKDLEELIVFITPRIASAGSENLPSAEQLWREQLKKTEYAPVPTVQPGNP